MQRTLIIAEAGVNHNGRLDLAKELAIAAKDAGADIVKFQTFNPDEITSKFAEMAVYQKVNIGKVKSQKEMLSELTLSHDEFVELFAFCKKIGIHFLSTPFDLSSIQFLDVLNCELWKIPSGEITNYPYLVSIAKTKKAVILSTGMSTLNEIENAMKLLYENGTPSISLLHCTTQYPTPYENVNLRAILTLKEKFNVDVGYSDHTNGIEVPIAAVAMGASIIEKHFTLDRKMEGPDHKASLEPYELRQMVDGIRQIEEAMGTGEKKPESVELENMKVARKSIVARRNIKKGEVLSEANITTKRPGTGLNPMLWPNVLGTKAIKDFLEDENIVI